MVDFPDFICVDLPTDFQDTITARRYPLSYGGGVSTGEVNFALAHVGDDQRGNLAEGITVIIGDPKEARLWPHFRLMRFPFGADIESGGVILNRARDSVDSGTLLRWLQYAETSGELPYLSEPLHQPMLDTAAKRLLSSAIRLSVWRAGGDTKDYSTVIIPDHVAARFHPTYGEFRPPHSGDTTVAQHPHLITAPWLTGSLLSEGDTLGINGEHHLRRVIDGRLDDTPIAPGLRHLSSGSLFTSRTAALVADIMLMVHRASEDGTIIDYFSPGNPLVRDQERSQFSPADAFATVSQRVSGKEAARYAFWSVQPMEADRAVEWVATLCIVTFHPDSPTLPLRIEHPLSFHVEPWLLTDDGGFRDLIRDHLFDFEPKAGRRVYTDLKSEYVNLLADVVIDYSMPVLVAYDYDGRVLDRQSLGQLLGDLPHPDNTLLEWPVAYAQPHRGALKLAIMQAQSERLTAKLGLPSDLSWIEAEDGFAPRSDRRARSDPAPSYSRGDGSSIAATVPVSTEQAAGQGDDSGNAHAAQSGGGNSEAGEGAGQSKDSGVGLAEPSEQGNDSREAPKGPVSKDHEGEDREAKAERGSAKDGEAEKVKDDDGAGNDADVGLAELETVSLRDRALNWWDALADQRIALPDGTLDAPSRQRIRLHRDRLADLLAKRFAPSHELEEDYREVIPSDVVNRATVLEWLEGMISEGQEVNTGGGDLAASGDDTPATDDGTGEDKTGTGDERQAEAETGGDEAADETASGNATPDKEDQAPVDTPNAPESAKQAAKVVLAIVPGTFSEDDSGNDLLGALAERDEAGQDAAMNASTDQATHSEVWRGLVEAERRLSKALRGTLPQWGVQLAEAYEETRLKLVESADDPERYNLLESDDDAMGLLTSRAARVVIDAMGGVAKLGRQPPTRIEDRYLDMIDWRGLIDAAISDSDCLEAAVRDNKDALPGKLRDKISAFERRIHTEVEKANLAHDLNWSHADQRRRISIFMAEVIDRITDSRTIPLKDCIDRVITVESLLPEAWFKMTPEELKEALRQQRRRGDQSGSGGATVESRIKPEPADGSASAGKAEPDDAKPAPSETEGDTAPEDGDKPLSEADKHRNKTAAMHEAKSAADRRWKAVIKKEFGSMAALENSVQSMYKEHFGDRVGRPQAKRLIDRARKLWIEETALEAERDGIKPMTKLIDQAALKSLVEQAAKETYKTTIKDDDEASPPPSTPDTSGDLT